MNVTNVINASTSIKFFSPLSVVILSITLFVVFSGVGCNDEAKDDQMVNSVSKYSGIPMLDIESPGLSAEIYSETVRIMGVTDQDKVYVMGAEHDVHDGKFDVVLPLDLGEHRVPVWVGNGLTTTTISMQIIRKTYEE
jgi:hypothetical protein